MPNVPPTSPDHPQQPLSAAARRAIEALNLWHASDRATAARLLDSYAERDRLTPRDRTAILAAFTAGADDRQDAEADRAHQDGYALGIRDGLDIALTVLTRETDSAAVLARLQEQRQAAQAFLDYQAALYRRSQR